MNKFNYKISIAALGLSLVVMAGCKKSFLEKPPIDAIVDAGFYQSDEQVLAGTASLYNRVWFDYNDKAYYNLGDFRSGTTYSAYNDGETCCSYHSRKGK